MDRVSEKETKKMTSKAELRRFLSARNCISASTKPQARILSHHFLRALLGMAEECHTEQCKVIIIHVRRCLLVIMQILPVLRSESAGI